VTIFFLSLFIGEKQWGEKKEEREQKYNVDMRKKVVKKLSQNNYTNIISSQINSKSLLIQNLKHKIYEHS